MISLNVDLRTLTWEQFVSQTNAYAIALDGYVRGGPKYDNARANFNHHEDVDRLATRSTCAQVLMAIRQGLFDSFRLGNDEPHANIYVNDCDEDVCTAWTLLKHHYLAAGTMNPILNRLVAMEDALDCTAGAYPFPRDLPALRELAWIYQPYRRFRLSGEINKRDPEAFRGIICDVEHRILKHIAGNGEEIALDTRYERIDVGNPSSLFPIAPRDWVMVREVGAQARTGMFADGIRVFVSVRELEGERYAYVIGKMSPFIRKNLTGLAMKLNETDGDVEDSWGGGDTVIGSPRKNGSRFKPYELAEIVDRF